MAFKRRFLMLIILIGAAVGAVAAYRIARSKPFTQVSSSRAPNPTNAPQHMKRPLVPDTSDWENCHNDKAGYELKYPKEWFVYGDDSRNPHTPGVIATSTCLGYGISLTNTPPTQLVPSVNDVGFSVRVDPDDGWGWWGRDRSKSVAGVFTPESLAGEKAVKTTYLGGVSFGIFELSNMPGNILFLGFHDHKVYAIDVSKSLDPIPLQAILQSFKFLEYD